MTTTKTQKRFTYEGFGFPVVLLDVPMVKVHAGVWTPRIDYDALAKNVLLLLAQKPTRLAGSEIRFVRQHFEMTLKDFGARFDVSHPAVLKWERAKDAPPALKWPLEKDIRLFILDRLGVRPKAFKAAYEGLRKEAKRAPRAPLRLSLSNAA